MYGNHIQKNYSVTFCQQENTFSNKMPRLTTLQRGRAIGMLEAGQSITIIARALRCSKSTILNLKRRFDATGSVADLPRTGRPRVTTHRQDRSILLDHLRNRFQPTTKTAAATVGLHGQPISRKTVMRRLQEQGMHCRRPFIGPTLTILNRANRLQWARTHIRWTFRQWNRVLFTDESRFCLSVADGRQRIWRRKGERHAAACVLQHNRFGGPSVMVWGGISGQYRTPLVVIDGNITAQRYVDEVLRPYVLPFRAAHPQVNIFQHDNARPHAARLTKDFLTEEEVPVMPWVPYSPDQNPIEHLWDELGRRVYARNPASRQALIICLQEEWEAIPQAFIQKLIHSMRNRCRMCIEANGGHTRY